MPTYDAGSFDPPAPVALVELRAPQMQTAIGDIPLLIDTGADVTLLPWAVMERLGVSPVPAREYELLGFDGTSSITVAVDIDLRLLRRTFRGRYLVINSPLGVLGRDILQHLALILDGPGSRWQELPRAETAT